MSIQSKYSESEIKNLTKEQYMREASYDDILQLDYKKFDVAVLIRESTNHEEQVKAFAVQKGYIINLVEETSHFILQDNNIYEEQGKSGLRRDDRPAFQLMCRRAAEHRFDILIVDAVSRLARNLRELMDVTEDFKELGIGIIILKEHYWTYNMTHTEVLRLAIDGGIAQAESMNTGKRVENHMAELARQGQLLGGDMFGYRLKKAVDDRGNPVKRNNSLIQEPVEAYTVLTIFRLFTSDDPEEVRTSSSICRYLIDNQMRTYEGDLNWTPSKVIRVLDNTKYMGYQLPGKSKVIDTVKKKKVLTKIEPVSDEVDENGIIIRKGNLVRIKCEPIVTEEMWWKAHNRKASRSCNKSDKIRGRKSGLRTSASAYGRKAFCSCGYALSRQYTHAAEEHKPAQYRYKCRWQVDHKSTYTDGGLEKKIGIICNNSAVGEMKLWLMSKYVFQYIFKNGKGAVLKTLELIEKSKAELQRLEDGTEVKTLEEERIKLKKRLSGYQDMRADGDMSANDFKVKKAEVEERIEEIDKLISQFELDKGKREKHLFDMQKIKEQLETLIDFKGYKISDEMIDMFVERIIYRGNDEFLWEMNLTGVATDATAKYRISSYNKEYSDYLKDDKNFNIVARMVISLDECQKYCEEEVGRRFVKRYWSPITIKIAVSCE